MKNSRKIVLMGLLIALDVVVARFLTISVTYELKIGFSFIPISLTGIIFGPWLGGAGAAIGDLIQCFLAGQGAPIPGITLDAFLSGAVYGLLLYRKKPSVLRCLIAAAICELLIGGLLSTFWLYLAFPGKTFIALFTFRIIKCLIMTPIETVSIYSIYKIANRTKILDNYIAVSK